MESKDLFIILLIIVIVILWKKREGFIEFDATGANMGHLEETEREQLMRDYKATGRSAPVSYARVRGDTGVVVWGREGARSEGYSAVDEIKDLGRRLKNKLPSWF